MIARIKARMYAKFGTIAEFCKQNNYNRTNIDVYMQRHIKALELILDQLDLKLDVVSKDENFNDRERVKNLKDFIDKFHNESKSI